MKQFLIFALSILLFFSCAVHEVEQLPEGNTYIPTSYEKNLLESVYGISIPEIHIDDTINSLGVYLPSSKIILVKRSSMSTEEKRIFLIAHEMSHHYQYTVLKRTMSVDKSYKYNYTNTNKY